MARRRTTSPSNAAPTPAERQEAAEREIAWRSRIYGLSPKHAAERARSMLERSQAEPEPIERVDQSPLDLGGKRTRPPIFSPPKSTHRPR